MVIKNGFCAVCGHKESIQVDDEPFTLELNYTNYSKFRRMALNRCSNCGYVAENLFDPVNENVKAIVQSKNYKDVLNHSYMGKFKDLPDREYLNLNINEFEAYNLVVKELNNNLISARCLANIADLKQSLSNTYLETQLMKEDESLDESYDTIVNSLSVQALNDNEQALNFLKGIKISDSFCKIFVAERLCFSYLYDQAIPIMEKLKQKVKFADDLARYVDNFMTEVKSI